MTQHRSSKPTPTERRPTLLPVAAVLGLLLLPTGAYAGTSGNAPGGTLAEAPSAQSESLDARSRRGKKRASSRTDTKSERKAERREAREAQRRAERKAAWQAQRQAERRAQRKAERRASGSVDAGFNIHFGSSGTAGNASSSFHFGASTTYDQERREARRRAKRKAERRRARSEGRQGGSGVVVIHQPTLPEVTVRPRARKQVVVVQPETQVIMPSRPGPRRRALMTKKSNWFHAGGGFGSVAGEAGDGASEAAGRAVAGGGGSIGAFYGGGEVALTGSKSEPLDITAAGMLGLTLPTRAFQPQLGVRAGVGQHADGEGLSPHVVVGPQLGFLLRKPGKRQGIRVMADLGFDHDISEKRISPEFFLTFSAVF